MNNGIEMPMQGFGVYQISHAGLCQQVVTEAIGAGSRLIDTASVYGNEEAVGAAVRQSGVPRNEIFITTKAWISEMGYDQTLRAFEASLRRLRVDYLDLYLIHMPFGNYYGAWKAMERLYAEKCVRAIGVCNFGADRLIDLCKNAEVIPAVNQWSAILLRNRKKFWRLCARYMCKWKLGDRWQKDETNSFHIHCCLK